MASIIKVDQIQTAAGGTPTAGSLGISGGLIKTVEYKPSSATVSATSYTDAIVQAHTFDSNASKFIALLTTYGNVHDGTSYTYFIVRLNWTPSSGTGVTTNNIKLGENGNQSSDWYGGYSLTLSGNTESSTGNFKVQGYIQSGGAGTGGISSPTLTILEFA